MSSILPHPRDLCDIAILIDPAMGGVLAAGAARVMG